MPDTPVTRVSVDAAALRSVLVALNGHPHQIRELQFTRDIDDLVGERNPINVLLDDFNAAADATNAESATTEQSSAVARSGTVPAAWREFVADLANTAGYMVNGNRLAAQAQALLAAAPEPPQGDELQAYIAAVALHLLPADAWHVYQSRGLTPEQAAAEHRRIVADTPRSGDAPRDYMQTGAPKRIYLGTGCDEPECAGTCYFQPGFEATWCADRLGPYDVEYVRADLVAPPADARDARTTICGQCSAEFPIPTEPHCYCPKCTRADSDRLSNMQSEYWSVSCFSTPTGMGDHSVGWRVSQDLGDGKGETVIAEVFNDDVRDALDLAGQVGEVWPADSAMGAGGGS
jgi:hypothetical protein